MSYNAEEVTIMRKMFRTVAMATFFLGCTVEPSTSRSSEPLPFCLEWNTMGDMDGGEAVTPAQRKMFHLGHFLTKSEFVRTVMVANYGGGLFTDLVVTCYEEHTPVLVEEVDAICACSKEDKRDEVNKAWNDYMNDCVREVKATHPKL
jgi:hypothetical protein